MTVWLSSDTLSSMTDEADRRYPLETGGVLVGYWTNANAAVVTDFVGPGPASIYGRYSYQHDHVWEAEQIAFHYERSGRSHVYIGDWHTHPNATSGNLSGTDRRSIRRVIEFREARAAHPLMLLLFGRPRQWEAAIWVSALKPRWGWRSRLLVEPAMLQRFEAAEGAATSL